MIIGLRLHDSEKKELPQRLSTVSGQGFKCVHVALSKLGEDKYKDAGNLSETDIQELKALFDKNNLGIAVLGCYLNLANPNKEKLEQIKQKYLEHIRVAALLGPKVVGTETGAPNEEYKYEEACHSEEALELFIGNLKPLVAEAKRQGVTLAIEPVWKHIVYNPQRARRVLDEIASPNLKIIFDPVNLLDISNYENRDEIFKEAIELLHDEIEIVHIKDFVVKDGALESVGAGKGVMDYERILSFIKKEKPFINVTLENTTPDTAEWSRQFIEDKWKSL